MVPEDFITFMLPYLKIVKDEGYFPSVFLAQSALESGWGRSPLSQVNNFWGHKWKSESDVGMYDYVNKMSNEEINGEMIPEGSRFRVYPNMIVAVRRGYCGKWKETWPDGSMKYNPDLSSPLAFIRSIMGTYCTDTEYDEKLVGIIEEWDFWQYDSVGDKSETG